jgi:tetratricopeptide (TPR) repeat protein
LDDALDRFKALLAQVDAGSGNPACDLLLAQLPPDQARCFRLCAIPHQFDEGVLGALLPGAEARDITYYRDVLSGLALVSVHGEALALHDSARTYLFGKWLTDGDPEFALASGRLADYFALRLREGNPYDEQLQRSQVFHRLGADPAAGTAELERLFAENRRAGRLAACEALLLLAHEYDPVLSDDHRDLLTYAEGVLAAERRDWARAEAIVGALLGKAALSSALRPRALARLGVIQLAQRRWDAALASLAEAETLAREAGADSDRLRIMSDLAVAYRNKGMRVKSENLIDEGIALAERRNDKECLAKFYNTLGSLRRSYSEHRAAIQAYETGLSRLDPEFDGADRASILNNIGEVYLQLSNWPESEKYFQGSLDISRKIADTFGQARELNNLARVWWNGSRRDDAVTASKTAANYFGILRDNYSAGVVTFRLARLYRSAKDKDNAAQAYGAAADFFRAAGETRDAAEVEAERATLLRSPGLPWWAWLAIGSFVLIIVLFFFVLAATAPSGA